MKNLVKSNIQKVLASHISSAGISKIIISAISIFFLFFVMACSNGLEGETYIDEQGTKILEFKSKDKVYVNAIFQTIEVPYTVDDDKVKLEIPNQGTTILTIEGDESITGMPMMGKLTKKED